MKKIEITPGSRYSKYKIYRQTKELFPLLKRRFDSSYLISDRDINYVISIKGNTIRIFFSDTITDADYQKMRKYIESLFYNSSIDIYGYSEQDFDWLEEIKNVRMRLCLN